MSPVILALDPGPDNTGWCLFDGRLIDSGNSSNEDLLAGLADMPADLLAIEMISSYGLAVGKDVFETCVWIGRFWQRWSKPEETQLIYRREVKLHLCGTAQAKDANVRQAILDQFPRTGGGKTPQVGTKAQPGPLYGVKTHAWSALAVAITCRDKIKEQ